MKKLLIIVPVCFMLNVLHAQRPGGEMAVASAVASKSAIPTGLGNEHLIEANTDITYTIFFQNTGTDTVYNVRVTDTLSVFLDYETVREESSSHLYNLTIIDGYILRFSFANIHLPNIAVNEAASKGFVTFSIAQKPDLPAKTVILNSAAVHFDFSTPALTNETYHTIGEGIVQTTNRVFMPGASLQVFPNPMSDRAVFVFEKAVFNKGSLEIFNLSGQKLDSRTFNQSRFEYLSNGLTPGHYFYKIMMDGNLAATGTFAKK